jgi:hypothetical protein
MRENKQLLFRMSENDFDQLTSLSADFGLTRNEYLRTMIRINYLVKEYANGNYKAKYRNDFGFELPEGMIEEIIRQMAISIPNIAENIEVKMAKQKPNVRHKKTMSKAI